MKRSTIRRTIASLGIAGSMLMTMPPASAETQQQRDWCYGKGDPTPEMQIAGCTAFIAAK